MVVAAACHVGGTAPPAPAARVVIFCDPGPDPDDIKVVVAAAVLHRQGQLKLEALICNGGNQAAERTALAKAVLANVRSSSHNSADISDGEIRVAMGVDSPQKYEPKPHEYNFEGFDEALKEIRAQENAYDGSAVFIDILQSADPQSITLQIQSGMRDVANAIHSHPQLVKEKVGLVSIMGGLQKTASGWEADMAANNCFDMAAARCVYGFCLAQGLRMHVVSRQAVPHLPMTLAKEFAGSSADTAKSSRRSRRQCTETSMHRGSAVKTMAYLYNAQKLGLIGLWGNVCRKTLVARCNKEWFFATFCGISKPQFLALDLEQRVGEHDDIEPWLCGTIKPYDVVAFMTLLPNAKQLFDFERAEELVNGTKHYFFVTDEQAPATADVEAFLRDIYTSLLLGPPQQLDRRRYVSYRRSISLCQQDAQSRCTASIDSGRCAPYIYRRSASLCIVPVHVSSM